MCEHSLRNENIQLTDWRTRWESLVRKGGGVWTASTEVFQKKKIEKGLWRNSPQQQGCQIILLICTSSRDTKSAPWCKLFHLQPASSLPLAYTVGFCFVFLFTQYRIYAAAVKKSLTPLKGKCTNGIVMTHPVLGRCDGETHRKVTGRMLGRNVWECFFSLWAAVQLRGCWNLNRSIPV